MEPGQNNESPQGGQGSAGEPRFALPSFAQGSEAQGHAPGASMQPGAAPVAQPAVQPEPQPAEQLDAASKVSTLTSQLAASRESAVRIASAAASEPVASSPVSAGQVPSSPLPEAPTAESPASATPAPASQPSESPASEGPASASPASASPASASPLVQFWQYKKLDDQQAKEARRAAGPRHAAPAGRPSSAASGTYADPSAYRSQVAQATRQAVVESAEQSVSFQAYATPRTPAVQPGQAPYEQAGSVPASVGSLRSQQQSSLHGEHAAVEVAPERPSALRSFLSFLIMLAIVVGAAWLLRTFVIAPYEIPSGSMEETIQVSDKVFSEKVSYYLHGVNPGDIVTFDDPEVAGRTLIKRCIAVGGQTVDLQDGMVYVDGQLMNEPYTRGLPSEPLAPASDVSIEYPYTVPPGYIWVMGDNRTNSADSRYFGAVPEASVSGHACLIYWPFDRFGPLS